MSQVQDALDGIADTVAELLPGWQRYVGYVESVVVPAFIVNIPEKITYEGMPVGKADFTVVLTAAVTPADSLRLLDFLSTDSVAGELTGARGTGWFGDLAVLEAGEVRLAPNGSAQVLAVDLTLRFIA